MKNSQLQVATDKAFRERHVAFDLEANGFYHYPEKVCLLQLGIPGKVYLIDTLAVDDLSPIGKLVADESVEKIFHSASYDIRSLDRDWGFQIKNLFDTSIAASFLGSEKLGLGSVLNEYLNLNLNKDKKLQRADWSRRPLGEKLLKYAIDDVRYLNLLRSHLYRKLKNLDRLDWVREECKRLTFSNKYSAPDPEWSFLNVKGSRALDGGRLAILRSIFKFRENEALRRDVPPFKIFSNAVIMSLVVSPDLKPNKIKGIGRYGSGTELSGLTQAILQGVKSPPINRTTVRARPESKGNSEHEKIIKERLNRLKEWRLLNANRIKLDGGLIWPISSLIRLSRHPNQYQDELESGKIRDWQNRVFGNSIQDILRNFD